MKINWEQTSAHQATRLWLFLWYLIMHVDKDRQCAGKSAGSMRLSWFELLRQPHHLQIIFKPVVVFFPWECFSGTSSMFSSLPFLSGVLCLLEHDEEYVFTLPCAYARSILTVPWVELGGKVSISCVKSGYSATVTFHTKPFYGGKVHRWVLPRRSAFTLHCSLTADVMGWIVFSFISFISKTVWGDSMIWRISVGDVGRSFIGCRGRFTPLVIKVPPRQQLH